MGFLPLFPKENRKNQILPFMFLLCIQIRCIYAIYMILNEFFIGNIGQENLTFMLIVKGFQYIFECLSLYLVITKYAQWNKLLLKIKLEESDIPKDLFKWMLILFIYITVWIIEIYLRTYHMKISSGVFVTWVDYYLSQCRHHFYLLLTKNIVDILRLKYLKLNNDLQRNITARKLALRNHPVLEYARKYLYIHHLVHDFNELINYPLLFVIMGLLFQNVFRIPILLINAEFSRGFFASLTTYLFYEMTFLVSLDFNSMENKH